MRLVDGEQLYPGGAQEVDRPVLREPLRRDVDELGAAGHEAGDRRRILVLALPRMERDRRDAASLQAAQLIAHQRDERRHDDDGRTPAIAAGNW